MEGECKEKNRELKKEKTTKENRKGRELMSGINISH